MNITGFSPSIISGASQMLPPNYAQMGSPQGVNSAGGAVDKDGDTGNSGAGGAQSATVTASYSVRISIEAQAQYQASQTDQTGQAGGLHHGHKFNAGDFMSKLDTSGLSADQTSSLQSILSQFDGQQMNHDKMKQLIEDLKNGGFDVQKLFDKFPRNGPGNAQLTPPPSESGNSQSTATAMQSIQIFIQETIQISMSGAAANGNAPAGKVAAA